MAVSIRQPSLTPLECDIFWTALGGSLPRPGVPGSGKFWWMKRSPVEKRIAARIGKLAVLSAQRPAGNSAATEVWMVIVGEYALRNWDTSSLVSTVARTASFGTEAGAEQASVAFFHRPLSVLTKSELVVLGSGIGDIRFPRGADVGSAYERRRRIASELKDKGLLSPQEFDLALAYRVSPPD